MPFTPPQFVNSLDRWTNPHRPATGPPDFTNDPYQIYAWSKAVSFWFDSTTGRVFPTAIIREPAAPPQGFVQPGDVVGKDLVFTDFPLLYLILFKQKLHSGFPNSYQACYATPCDRNGVPLRNPSP